MSFLTTPILVTPLLKVPLLLTAAACNHFGNSPPTPPPAKDEEEKYNKVDTLTNISMVMIRMAQLTRTVLTSLALAESAVILAQTFPSPLSDRVLDTLLPAGAAPLQLTPAIALGAALVSAGGLIRIQCHRTLGRFFTWQLAVLDGHKLITWGPYSVVRHPSYIGFLLLMVGEGLLNFSPGSYFASAGLFHSAVGRVAGGLAMGWLTFVGANMLSRVNTEDAVLRKEFGSQWDVWARNTPYKLIPYVY